MEKQKKMKAEQVEKKDILEEVKELDKQVRTKIVYEKLGNIKKWAKEIAELKFKTQFLLEELGVDEADIKRLIDYATNSPEAQLDKEDKADLKDEVRDTIASSRKKIEKKMAESVPYAYVMSAGAVDNMTTGGDYTYTSSSGTSADGTTTWVATGGTDDIEFNIN